MRCASEHFRGRVVCSCLVFAVSSACEGSRTVTTGDGQPPVSDAGLKDAPSVSDSLPPLDLSSDRPATKRCVIAYRHTMKDACCCDKRFVTTTDELAADPCVVEAPLDWIPQPGPGCGNACFDACDCVSPRPPSRTVAWRDGTCQFIGECATVADCVLATDTRGCCSCPQVYPTTLVDRDDCLVPGTLRGAQSPASSCNPACNWLCPTAGVCADPKPLCEVTAKLPIYESSPQKICSRLH